jgi:glucose-1-phosphate adenylyltransferase
MIPILLADSEDPKSKHDFGKDILPRIISKHRVFAYNFVDENQKDALYWRDVGTLDAYYDANIELVHVRPELNIYDEDWPIWTYQVQQPPAKFVLDEDGRRGTAINSMVSGGCIISGAVVRESLLFSNVRVEERTNIYRSVILPNAEIGRNCIIRGAIVDDGGEIPDGTTIGVDREADARRFHVTEKGVVLVTPDMLRALRGAAR